MDVTLWQIWWDVWHFLRVDVRPVKVVIRVLLVIALREAFIKCTASCRQKKTHYKVDLLWQYYSLQTWLKFTLKQYLCSPPLILSHFLFFLPLSCCLSSFLKHQESELHQSSLEASEDHPWLKHQSLQLIIWAHHLSLGGTMCELAASGSALTGSWL